MTTAYLPSIQDGYNPGLQPQEYLTFETSAELVADMQEHLESSYLLLERDDV